MILKIFTVYDQKARCHLQPFCFPEEGQARRVFADSCNDEQHTFGRHPEDFTLVTLGEYDDEAGTILAYNTPQHVATGLSVLLSDMPGETAETGNGIDVTELPTG